MTKVLAPSQTGTSSDGFQYLPFTTFFEKVSKKDAVNPYSSTFSFIPYLEKMRAHRREMGQAIDTMDTSCMSEMEKVMLTLSSPEQLDSPEKRGAVVGMFLPSLFFEGQLGFVAKPFTKEFFYMTPDLQEVFTSDEWEVRAPSDIQEIKMGSPALEAGKLILNTFHGQQFDTTVYQTMVFRNKKTMLEKHLKINVVLDYIKTTPKKEIHPLSQAEIHELYNQWNNEAYWLKHFPPEDFAFEGLVVGYMQDVTEVEVLSEMKEMMISNNEDEDLENSDAIRAQLNHLICSYLQISDLDFGNLLDRDFKYSKLFSWSVIGGLPTLASFTPEDFYNNSTYGRVKQRDEVVIIGDLRQIAAPNVVELHLIQKGYRSLLLSPQKDQHGQMIGIMELAAKEPYRFNNKISEKLNEVISLFSVGTNRWIQIMDNNINFFIQKQFTYIHPSVEWKFQEVSQKFLFTPPQADKTPVMEPIAFKDVYPLYGQADIVGSSKIRNRSIEADMLDNLERVQKVIKAFRKRLQFQLLDIYLNKTEAFRVRLEGGGFVSSDESQIVELLTEEIHPLLIELSNKYDRLPKGIIKKYFDYLDPKLNIVYRQRRDYEDSVHQINDLISGYIDKEVAKKQEILPHFFEKYITDGVEYNIYLGQSILQEGAFSQYFLKDFRLWQLILMCEVTRLVARNEDKLPVPLSTAQLIFLYNNALSIRFNMDEKQFDVDGAYNVRYEILKKRIDKAVIKGTKERLTQKGKVAIVWLQEKDRIEYLEYIQHLLEQGYITDSIEELELERLQGADGLKALRVTVAV